MSWWRRLYGLDRGDDTVVDPDAVVHVASLPFWQAPLIMHELEQRGITARAVENSVPHTLGAIGKPIRVFVLERDREAAEAAIRELTAD